MSISKKAVALGLTVALTGSMFAGCGKDETSSGGNANKVTYWKALSSAASAQVTNLGESPFAKKLQEITGVEVEFIHPPQGQTAEKFSVLISSKDMPDIIEHKWMTYPGGPAKALKDGVIIGLNEYEQYAPNLFGYFAENPTVKKLTSDDNGTVFAFPFIRGTDSLCVSSGLVVRYDWLEELGLDIPETIDEWEVVLRAFKEKKGATAPLTCFSYTSGFIGAYGVGDEFYQDDGVVKYGPAQPAFKDYLARMASWYKEGLLDNAFSTLDSQTLDYNILNGKTGVTVGAIGGGIGKWTSASEDPNFVLGPAPSAVLNKGDSREFGYRELQAPGTFAAITSSCENIESAMKVLDAPYAYEGDAYMLYNFGVEGESYEMIDGYPTFTDMIKNNSEGKSMQEAMSVYTMSYSSGPFLQDVRYMEQYGALPEQRKAMEVWSDTNAAAHILPHMYPDDADLTESARLKSDVTKYTEEMALKFMMGVEPIENFDSFVAGLKERGLDRLLEIQQKALDKYNKR